MKIDELPLIMVKCLLFTIIIEVVIGFIIGIRNIRAQMNIHPSKKSKLIFVTKNAEDMINSSRIVIEKLGFASEIEIRGQRGEVDSNSSSIITKDFEVIIPLGDLVDLDEEKKRLETEIKKLESEVERASKMLSNPGFTSKAPASKIEEEKQKLAKYEEMLNVAKKRYEKL